MTIKNTLKFEQYLQQIIASPSISAFDASLDQTNLPLVNTLAQWFENFGFEIVIQPVPGSRDKYNLLAKIGTGEGGLLLAGHTDTVPYDQGLWQYDPFKLQQTQDKLFGLGVCDMKSFFAFILEALVNIPLNKLQKPLYILATADEETSMAGARFFAQQQLIKPDMAIIGEPTSLRPIYKHKGHMGLGLDIRGQSGHSSAPDKGVNAIELMQQALSQLLTLQQKLKRQHQDPSFDVPETTLNLGHIHGGDGENRICGSCRLTFDIRPVPGLDEKHVMAMLDECLHPLQQKYPQRFSLQALYPHTPAFSCAEQSNVIELAQQLTGFSPKSANYCTEAPFISSLGCHTLILGPGNIEQAHQPDEYLLLEKVKPTFELLTQFIHKVCL